MFYFFLSFNLNVLALSFNSKLTISICVLCVWSIEIMMNVLRIQIKQTFFLKTYAYIHKLHSFSTISSILSVTFSFCRNPSRYRENKMHSLLSSYVCLIKCFKFEKNQMQWNASTKENEKRMLKLQLNAKLTFSSANIVTEKINESRKYVLHNNSKKCISLMFPHLEFWHAPFDFSTNINIHAIFASWNWKIIITN